MRFFAWTIVRTNQVLDAMLELQRMSDRVTHLQARLTEKTTEAAKWEARASQFIDQVALGSGILQTPSMTPSVSEAALPQVRQVMAALGRTELQSKRHSEAVPSPAPSLIGVNEQQVAAALAAVRNTV